MKKYLVVLATITILSPCAFFNLALANETYAEISMNEVQAGSLLLPGDEPGRYLQQPAMDTSIDVVIVGMQATHRITQTFTNPTVNSLNATYVFPLPDNAAVDTLLMAIGGREIEGEIQTKDEARRIYRQAKNTGHRASLVERHRPNLFSTQLANIGAGESIEVTIGFQSSVRYDDGIFHLSLPTTITPRYKPGMQFQTQSIDAGVQATISNNNLWGAVPNVKGLPNTSVLPGSGVHSADAGITVTVHGGFPLSQVRSDSHPLDIRRDGLKWTITPSVGRIPMDRDFSVSWQPLLGQSPLAAVFAQHPVALSDDSFVTLMVVPPQTLYEDRLPPREVIFVLDKSGSMGGSSMPAAKKALKLGIEGLSMQDSFNVITFSNNTRRMFGEAVSASRLNKKTALAKISMVSAGGGTNILGAFSEALKKQSGFNASASQAMRQIVFITDGSVGNEAEVYAYLKQHLADNRVFTVGIGKAPNRWFMRKAAEHGRGSYTYIATTAEVQEKMRALFHKINHPVLSNVKLVFNGIELPEFYPQVVPDLYAGEPLIVNARVNGGLTDGELVITGNHDGLEWSQNISLAPEAQLHQTGLDKQWAYNKISALEDQLLFTTDLEAVKTAATDTALKYGIVTDYTSLVAVDKTKNMPARQETFAQAHTDESVPVRSAASSNGGSLSGAANSNVGPVATNAVVSAPSGTPMAVPEGNLGIVARLLLSLLLASGVAIYARLTGGNNETV